MYPNEDNQPPQTAPPIPVYQPPSSSPSSPVTPQQPTGEDPGKTLAIVGIILAFFFSIIGLIVSLVARGKSRSAGYPTTLATVGIVLNSVFILLGLVTLGIMAAITIVAYNGIQERAQESKRTSETRQIEYASTSTAMAIAKKAEAYSALHGSYPTALAQLEASPETALSQDERAAISPSSISDKTDKIAIYTCDEGGLAIEYWNPSTTAPSQYTTGDTIFSAQTCRIIE